ncbi:hypothetical protein [Streptomyces sp. NPDC052496]|uniref:hypothetical protein n=1 Tax=Streptomyces sp. NPDC052496 TaxID=3154951 RepID=UPI0034304EBE
MSTTPESRPEADAESQQEPRRAEGAERPRQPKAPASASAAAAAALIFDDPLDRQSSDDTDRGWGERPSGGGSAADLARFLDEKPPHHL